MRAALASLLLLVACGATPPQTTASTTPTRAVPTPPSASSRVTRVADAWSQLCSGPESLPLEVAGSREFVRVTLPGSKTPEALRFHVDTGGNTAGLMIHRSVAERLGFSSVEALPRSIRIGDREVTLPEGANWLLADDAGDHGKFERAVRGDFSVGQIGAGFLSRYVVCIDPAKGRLGLGDPKRFDLDPGDAKWVPLFMLPGGTNRALYPFVHVVLRDRGTVSGSYGLLLDTGATSSMLERKEIEHQRTQHPDWATANGAFGDADMIGGQFAEKVLRVEDVAVDAPRGALAQVGLEEHVSVDVGPTTFVDRPTGAWRQMFGVVEATQGSHGVIANDVLLRFRLLVDYPHSRLFMEPSGRKADASASSVRVGLSLVLGADGCPEVRRITDTNDKSVRDNLQTGDVLVAVDGQDVCKRYHHEIAAALAGPPGTKKKLRVRRGAATVDVEGVTAELLVHSSSAAR
jgi:hypothetical protein